MTAKWIQFDPSKLYPDELVDVASVCQTTAETLGTGVRLIASATRVAAIFAQNFVDAELATINATKDLIYSVVQQLVQTGVYWTFHIPGSFTQKLTPSRWLSDVANSFDDRMDSERPILPTKGFVGALVICGTTESYPLLIENFRALFELFQKFVAPVEQTKLWKDPGDPWNLLPGIGQVPNWGNKTLAELVPPIGDLARVLLGFADQITAASSSLLSEYADFLDIKADQLEDISTRLDAIIQQLENFLNFEGAWVLPIYGEFDSKDLQLILTHSEGGPLDSQGNNYTGGCMFLSTGGTSADALFNLFGIQKTKTTLPDLKV